MFRPNEPIINQSTVSQHLADDSHDRRCGTMPRRDEPGSVVGAPLISSSFQPIPRSQWSQRIAAQVAEKSRLSDRILEAKIRCKHQGRTNYCHGNSPVIAAEILRLVGNQPYVPLSGASVAGPTVNFTNSGGYIANNLRQIVEVGAASEYFVPPNQIGASGFRAGWREDAANYRVTEWWDLGRRHSQTFDLVMTLVLSSIPVCVALNWWRHAITFTDGVDFGNGKFGLRGWNSWGAEYGSNGFFVLDEQYGTPDEAYAPRGMVQSSVSYSGKTLLT